MADLIQAKLIGSAELRRRLKKMNPAQNRRITNPALLESMQLTLRIAAQRKIKRGGGKGSPPVPNVVTSHSGTLRRSLAASFAIDRSGLPKFIEGGSNVGACNPPTLK